jgi:hypothetical protein
LIGNLGYAPWGLVFDRQSIYDAGGGPVWYPRADEYEALKALGSRVRAWTVRLDAGSSDWLEEREWRIPVALDEGQDPAVWLPNLRLIAVLVEDVNWSPLRLAIRPDPATGAQDYGPALPAVLQNVPRWWWNPTTRGLAALPALL